MLPVNLQSAAGSNASLTARATDRVWWDGMGLDGSQKCPLILFMLRYIKNYADFFIDKVIVNVAIAEHSRNIARRKNVPATYWR